MAFDDVVFNVKSKFDGAELQKGSRIIGGLATAVQKTALGMVGLAKSATAAGIAFKALLVLKVAGWLNDVANRGIAAAESLKQLQYETGISAGHFVELQRELGLFGEQAELLQRAIKGDVAALRELEEANDKVAAAIRQTGQEAAGVAGMDPSGIYAALAAQASISESRIAATNERLTDMSDVLDDTGGAWEELSDRISESLGAAKDDIDDFLDLGGLKDSIAQLILDNFVETGTEAKMREQYDAWHEMKAAAEEYGVAVGGVWSRLSEVTDGATLRQRQLTALRLKEMRAHFDEFGVHAGGVFSRLREHAEAEMHRIVLAAEQAAREANARLRAISMVTPTVPNPAQQRSVGPTGTDPNPEAAFEAITADNYSRDYLGEDPYSGESVPTIQDIEQGRVAPAPEDSDIYAPENINPGSLGV